MRLLTLLTFITVTLSNITAQSNTTVQSNATEDHPCLNLFFQSRLRILGDESGTRITRLITLEEVRELDEVRTIYFGRTYSRMLFGMPVTQALTSGYQLTTHGYFEMNPTSIAVASAKLMRRECLKFRGDKTTLIKPLQVLEPFAGSGQDTWAMLSEGLSVTSYEKDPLTFRVLKHNIFKFFDLPTNRISIINGDGAAALNELSSSQGNSFDVVYLDPPWKGSYKHTQNKPISLPDLHPSNINLVTLAIKVAPLVVMRLPKKANIAALKSLAKTLGRKVNIEYVDVSGMDGGPEPMILAYFSPIR